jgi:hypothetical protein
MKIGLSHQESTLGEEGLENSGVFARLKMFEGASAIGRR